MTIRRSPRRSGDRPWAETPWTHSVVFVVAALALVATVLLNRGADQTGATPGASTGQDVASTGEGDGNVPAPVNLALTAPLETSTATPIPPTPRPTATPEPTEVPLEDGEKVKGVVLDAEGEPIPGAIVRVRTKIYEADAKGRFQLTYRSGSDRMTVSASGYADRSLAITERPRVALERFDVKGVYLNGTAAGDADLVDAMIDLIDETELNAIVVDIKDGVLFYDSQVDFFRDAGMVRPTYDAAELLDELHEHDIYVIARQVVFKDPLVAEANPDLAIKDEETGGIWRGWAGEAWVNPLEKGLYQPNVDLAVEATRLGFDEIQYDYIRFPDGDLSGADLGKRYEDVENRVAALTTILSMTREALRPLGGKLSADIFGWMLLVDDDQGIGQRLPDMVAVVDYVSPMIYPSHFPKGSVAVDGHPNDFPFETVEISLSLGISKIPGAELKVRPWLQDFSLPDMTEYGAHEIRAQIQATESVGASGWLMWNVNATYVDEAYDPATD